MIEFAGPQPSPDEVAAIVAALGSLAIPAASATQPTPAWTLAMRHDELDYDELRAMFASRQESRPVSW
jgi:hypothetical protein